MENETVVNQRLFLNFCFTFHSIPFLAICNCLFKFDFLFELLIRVTYSNI